MKNILYLESVIQIAVRSIILGLWEKIVKDGKRVKRGDTLLTIDGKVAISKKVKAQTNFDNALKEYNRHCKLYQEDFISKESLDQSKAKLDVASSDSSKQKTIMITWLFKLLEMDI